MNQGEDAPLNCMNGMMPALMLGMGLSKETFFLSCVIDRKGVPKCVIQLVTYPWLGSFQGKISRFSAQIPILKKKCTLCAHSYFGIVMQH